MAQREKDYQFSISSMKAERLKDKAYGNSEAVKTMDSQIKMAEGMQTELINAGKEIKSMKSITDQIFSIKAFKELQNGDAFTTYIQDKKTVLFVFDGQNFGSLLHEFSHGYDFLKGENSFKYTDQSKVNFNDLKSIRSDQRGKEGR